MSELQRLVQAKQQAQATEATEKARVLRDCAKRIDDAVAEFIERADDLGVAYPSKTWHFHDSHSGRVKSMDLHVDATWTSDDSHFELPWTSKYEKPEELIRRSDLVLDQLAQHYITNEAVADLSRARAASGSTSARP